MLDDWSLETISARLSALSGGRWEVVELDGRWLVVKVIFADGHRTEMRVTRDSTPARKVDVQFIGHSRSDVELLLLAVRGKMVLSPEEIASIEARCRAASPAPWRAFIEADGGIGGCDVIQVSYQNNKPRLYLCFGSGL